MPETKSNRPAGTSSNPGGGQNQAIAQRERDKSGLYRRDAGIYNSPFAFMDQMAEEMDRTFDRFFRDWGMPRRSWLPAERGGSARRERLWSPRIDAFQNADRFIVRAELPGLKKDDVQVEVTEEAITIQGERHEEHEEQREGYYHSEREYGHFHRTIPLPEGVITESAQASFKNGVLEISMQAPPAEASRGRRLDIKEESENQQQK